MNIRPFCTDFAERTLLPSDYRSADSAQCFTARTIVRHRKQRPSSLVQPRRPAPVHPDGQCRETTRFPPERLPNGQYPRIDPSSTGHSLLHQSVAEETIGATPGDPGAESAEKATPSQSERGAHSPSAQSRQLRRRHSQCPGSDSPQHSTELHFGTTFIRSFETRTSSTRSLSTPPDHSRHVSIERLSRGLNKRNQTLIESLLRCL